MGESNWQLQASQARNLDPHELASWVNLIDSYRRAKQETQDPHSAAFACGLLVANLSRMFADFPTLRELAAAVRGGQRDPLEVVETCLAQIDRHEAQVQAWVLVDAAGARQSALRLRAALQRGEAGGELCGIPVGIKDIIDVAHMPTRAGSRLRSHAKAERDAPIVAQLRQQGAIILGKTVTTEFACFDPSPTRNPWNLTHSPGGSSSGSAAAVALRMCLAALGSQTGGSIIRPASYCGIAGLKPTFGSLSLDGFVPVSFHLDHPGVLARSAADLQTLWRALRSCSGFATGLERADSTVQQTSSADPLPERPRLRLVRAIIDPAEDEVRSVTWDALQKLHDACRESPELSIEQLPEAMAMHRTIMAVEVAQYHRDQYGPNRGAYGPELARLIEEGLGHTAVDYAAALDHQRQFRRQIVERLGRHEIAVMAATNTIAPARLDTTGDPQFNSLWSYLGFPAVTVPCGVSQSGMPCGLQLVASPDQEDLLLSAADWCQQRLEWNRQPELVVSP